MLLVYSILTGFTLGMIRGNYVGSLLLNQLDEEYSVGRQVKIQLGLSDGLN